MAGADELGQQPVVSELVPHSAGDDRRVNFQLGCESHDGHAGRVPRGLARVPGRLGYQRLLGEFVRLGLLGTAVGLLAAAQRVVVHERGVFARVEVPADVRQLVQEAEPEVVDPVVAESQADHGRAVCHAKGGAVQMRLR